MTAPAVNERAASPLNGAGYSPSFVHKPKGASSVIEGEHAEVLQSIRRTNVDLAIWRHELPPALASWLDASPICDWPDLRQVLAPAEAARTLRDWFFCKHASGFR
ncbi:MAG: DUF1826 domain-containing protein [Methylocystis sp.]|nr:DUF1826 domain-containing protein [Methylocystis sp.]